MDTAPSIDFKERVDSEVTVQKEDLLPDGRLSYFVQLIESDDTLEEIVGAIDATFDESVFVLVGDKGSSSVEKRWTRVEATSAGVHLHGYLHHPCRVTADISPRYSLLEIQRPPNEVDVACVSLTKSQTERIHLNSTDSRVQLVSAVMASDNSQDLGVQLKISTADGQSRVDTGFTIEAHKEWKGIGLIGEPSEVFTVEVTIDALDAHVTEEYRGETGTLGIRIEHDGEVIIGRSNEI